MRTKLQEARKSKKATQNQVAEHLNIAMITYQKIELGERDGSAKNWLKLHEYFEKKIQLDELMKNT